MSDSWVDYVISKMQSSNSFESQQIGNTLFNLRISNPQIFTKYVNAVDKSTGDIWFMKLSNFK